MNAYHGLGASQITFNLGPAWQQCMNEELAKCKAVPHSCNTARCTPMIGKPAGAGLGLGYYIAGGALLVGGAAWYFFFRKPSAN